MSSDSSAEPSTGRFYFRGQERIDVIENLARKELTLAAIATKYGRGHDTLRQFSARNHAEILRRRRELQGELNAATVDQWVSEKAQLGDLYWKHYEDIDARLSDPSLDDRAVVLPGWRKAWCTSIPS